MKIWRARTHFRLLYLLGSVSLRVTYIRGYGTFSNFIKSEKKNVFVFIWIFRSSKFSKKIFYSVPLSASYITLVWAGQKCPATDSLMLSSYMLLLLGFCISYTVNLSEYIVSEEKHWRVEKSEVKLRSRRDPEESTRTARSTHPADRRRRVTCCWLLVFPSSQ